MKPTARLAEAFAYANELHAAQQRKDSGIPYITHLMSVAALVMEFGGDEEQAMAGLLHDAVEDQGGLPTLEEIRKRFGPRVADIVEGCTDAVVIPKPPWRERKEAYIAHLARAHPDVLLVSCCDKLHNATCILRDYREIGEAIWDKFRGGKDGTLWYYRALVDAFRGAGGPGTAIAELERIVGELEALAAGAAGT